MLSEEDDVGIHALKRQGMTINEIARRTDHDCKTIRAYLTGQRTPRVRRCAAPDPFHVFVDYVTARLPECARQVFETVRCVFRLCRSQVAAVLVSGECGGRL